MGTTSAHSGRREYGTRSSASASSEEDDDMAPAARCDGAGSENDFEPPTLTKLARLRRVSDWPDRLTATQTEKGTAWEF